MKKIKEMGKVIKRKWKDTEKKDNDGDVLCLGGD